MQIHYKCRCMKEEATIDVPDRRPGSDLMVWMEAVQHCIYVDHKGLSPLCMTTAMQYAKIPFEEGGEGVGIKATRN